MLKKWLCLAALAAMTMFMTPGISSAQRGGRGGGRGMSSGGRGWSGGSRGWNGGGRGWDGNRGWNNGWAYGLGGFGLGYALGSYGGYGGYNYGSPYYGSSYYYEPEYSYSEPAYNYVQPSTIVPSAYAEEESAGIENPNAAMMEVRVPANAEVWVEGDKTSQTGTVRHFVSPTLQTGKTFTYDIRARWTGADGKAVDRTKHVKVQAGARVGVDFNNP